MKNAPPKRDRNRRPASEKPSRPHPPNPDRAKHDRRDDDATPTGRRVKPRVTSAEHRPDAIVKEVWKPGTMLYPVPIVMVTSASREGKPNIASVAWAGTVCSDPPMISISLRKATLSHGLILASREFVVNVPSVRQVQWADYCGVVSGRTVDKFEATGLTPHPAQTVAAPLILECPINIECAVKKILELGSHTLFLAEVSAVQVTRDLIDASGRLALEKAGLAAYVHGDYVALDKKLGFFGFSVQRKKSGYGSVARRAPSRAGKKRF